MKRVLIADDTKNIRLLVRKCLEMEGYTVDEAVDGQQALGCLRTGGYALAFLDIKMPGASGTEVLRTIRAEGYRVPIVIVTAYATVKNAVECTQLGAVAYLHKPFTADKLRGVLREVMLEDHAQAGRRLLQEGKPQEALLELKKALGDSPLDAAVYRLLALASARAGNPEDAAKYVRIARTLEPEKP
jgi:DNA-binding NtrC family response regulator